PRRRVAPPKRSGGRRRCRRRRQPATERRAPPVWAAWLLVPAHGFPRASSPSPLPARLRHRRAVPALPEVLRDPFPGRVHPVSDRILELVGSNPFFGCAPSETEG